MTPQIGTAFPARLPGFLHAQAGVTGVVVWEGAMWQPIFIIVQFIIVLWRELNCVKIPQGKANKSTNNWGDLRAKGGVLPPSVCS
jgi:hypothetical protein